MSLSFETSTALATFNDLIDIFRTDLITPMGCGNKHYKLTENLLALKRQGCRRLLTFGGVWSNHLHAFAVACNDLGITAVAAVRGEECATNALLADAINHGLEVHYLSRADYRLRGEVKFARELCHSFGCDAWLPEGGSNQLAVRGCEELAHLINQHMPVPPAHIVLAVGTGATLAGIVRGCQATQNVIGIPVVRDDRVSSQVQQWVGADSDNRSASWKLLDKAVTLKYAKVDDQLLRFVLGIYEQHGIVLDPVYNGKAFKALLESELVNTKLAKRSGRKIVFVHTGGAGGCLGYASALRAVGDRCMADDYLNAARSMLGLSQVAHCLSFKCSVP